MDPYQSKYDYFHRYTNARESDQKFDFLLLKMGRIRSHFRDEE